MRFDNKGYKADESGVSFPLFKMFGQFGCLVIILFVLGGIVGGVGYVAGWFGEAAAVAREELGPRALLKKYEWFKNASASLDRHRANLDAYKQRLASLKESYGEEPRSKWDRTDKEDWNQWHTEALGILATYNGLAAEYNAQMSKINWRFTNVGDLPEGQTEVLPRERPTIRPYRSHQHPEGQEPQDSGHGHPGHVWHGPRRDHPAHGGILQAGGPVMAAEGAVISRA